MSHFLAHNHDEHSNDRLKDCNIKLHRLIDHAVELGLKGIAITENMRKSVDGNKVILHYSFIEPILKDGEEVVTYEYDSKILKDILESEEWKSKEIEQNGIETT